MPRSAPYDLLVIGGGINGCGIAADAAGRGLAVLLAERDDLASGTSSASSKLIHGGLRYLEHFELRLVRQALAEREVLLAAAPHIVWPLRFLMPSPLVRAAGQRPDWMLRAGLFLYDHLARRRRIPGSGAVSFADDPAGAALAPRFRRGFSYWDCWVDDARLVVLNARAAARHGAEILTRTPVVALHRDGALWRIELGGANPRTVTARAVVNAAGPWAAAVAQLTATSGAHFGRAASAVGGLHLRLVRGSHIVVPRIPGGSDAFILQNADGRVVFALPFEGSFTLIGTTDVPHTDGLVHVEPAEHEVDYLLEAVNRYLRHPLDRRAIVWQFAGIRPLDNAEGTQNPSAVTRDWRLVVDAGEGGPADIHVHAPPLVHVVGGKITTYRRLAEAALDRLSPYFPGLPGRWTAGATLPGGALHGLGPDDYAARIAAERPGLPLSFLSRLARRHGSDTSEIIGDSSTIADLGEDFGGGLCAREVAFLRGSEWAITPEDILWRRTRAGLHIAPSRRAAVIERLAHYL